MNEALQLSPVTGAAPAAGSESITEGDMIPDVLTRHPELRGVFDHYGLRGCGGGLGPSETVAYFARAHGVDRARLLGELNGARGSPPRRQETTPTARAADSIYRRFFLAGIAATLTAGATWGAVLLLRLALSRTFGSLSVAEVNAHGHAQIFGWVGLFVMGFAYQAFPRFKHSSLPHPGLALLTFPVYLAGLIARTIGEPLAAHPGFLACALSGSLLEVLAVSAFAGIVARTLLGPGASRTASDAYILAATFWFLVQAIYDGLLLYLTSTAPSPQALVERVATYQAPLRDLQLHGFALLMILGVSQRFLPGMLGLGTVPARSSLAALAALNLGLLAEVGGFFGLRLWGSRLSGILVWAGVAVIALGTGYLAFRLRVSAPSEERDRSLKFIRAAYAWLGVSLAMLLLFPLYLAATRQPFSHAYFGATRHAITVGFVSLMIVGVASKVVPTLNGVPGTALPALWVPFALLNTGCSMRVVFQALTDFTPAAFPLAGASGVLEVTGLLLWAVPLAGIMLRGPVLASGRSGEAARPSKASPHHVVGWLTRLAPETIEVFQMHGFAQIRNPILRATVANSVTIRQACRLRGIDEAALLGALDEALARGGTATPTAAPGFRLELPVLDADGAPPPEAGSPIDPRATVAEIVRRHPEAVRVFARHRLDACCGGGLPLAEAVRRHGLSLEEVLAELAGAVGRAPAPTSARG